MTQILEPENKKRYSTPHRGLLKEARDRLHLIIGGIGMVHPMSEQFHEINDIIKIIEDALEIQQ